MGTFLPPTLTRVAADQRVRFLVVGGVNTVVGYSIYAVLAKSVFADVFLGYVIALAMSYAISTTLAFVLYRRFVFVVHGNVLVDFVRFVSVYAVAISANLVTLPVLVELTGLNPLIAQAIVLVVTTIISFVGHKHVSFRRKLEPDPARREPEGFGPDGPRDGH